jgi:hypothetical protein
MQRLSGLLGGEATPRCVLYLAERGFAQSTALFLCGNGLDREKIGKRAGAAVGKGNAL